MLFTFFRRAQVYVPDDVLGGGERAVLEARALGVRAVVEPDNPKLAELLGSPVYDHAYYAAQLRYALGLLDLRLAHALGAAAASAEAATAGDWARCGRAAGVEVPRGAPRARPRLRTPASGG